MRSGEVPEVGLLGTGDSWRGVGDLDLKAMIVWARLVLYPSNSSLSPFPPPAPSSPVRTFLSQLASLSTGASDSLHVSLPALGGSVATSCRIQRQEWALDQHSWAHAIDVFHVLSVGAGSCFPVWPGASIPVWSGQVPPPAGEARRQFDRAVIYGNDDDEFGIAKSARLLIPSGMQKAGLCSSLCSWALQGVPLVVSRGLETFGLRGGHYKMTRDLSAQLTGLESDLLLPNGESMWEGPLSFVPWILVPLLAVPKVVEGVNSFRACADHTKTGLNGAFIKQSPVLPTVDEFVELLESDAEMAIYDLAQAFCHWNLASPKRQAFGRQDLGTGSYMVRRNLDFGASPGPYYCQALADNLVSVLREAQVLLVMYLDDVAVTGKDLDHDDKKFRAVALLIGLWINFLKLQRGRKVIFLGRAIDSQGQGRMTLPPKKVLAYVALIETVLASEVSSMATLASLAGKLTWASMLVPSSASRLIPVYRCLWGDFSTEEPDRGDTRWTKFESGDLPRFLQKAMRGPVSCIWRAGCPKYEASRKVSVTEELVVSLTWWRQALSANLGVSLHLLGQDKGRWRRPHSFGDTSLLVNTGRTSLQVPIIVSDACRSAEFAGGGWWCGDCSWSVQFSDQETRAKSINYLELLATSLAVQVIGPSLSSGPDSRVLTVGDNQAAVAIINKGCSGDPHLNTLVQDLMDFAVESKIELAAHWVPTAANTRADLLSRGTGSPAVNCFLPTRSLVLRLETLAGVQFSLVWPGHDGLDASLCLKNVLFKSQETWGQRLQGVSGTPLIYPAFSDTEGLFAFLRKNMNQAAVVLVPVSPSLQRAHWWRRAQSHSRRIWPTADVSEGQGCFVSFRSTAQFKEWGRLLRPQPVTNNLGVEAWHVNRC